MAEIVDIVTKLWERTNQHKIEWDTTVNENTFLANIGKLSSVTITYYKHGHFDEEDVRFRILDETGRVLKEYDTDESEDIAVKKKLIEIYNEARRTALRIDSHLDELLAALDEDPIDSPF